MAIPYACKTGRQGHRGAMGGVMGWNTDTQTIERHKGKIIEHDVAFRNAIVLRDIDGRCA